MRFLPVCFPFHRYAIKAICLLLALSLFRETSAAIQVTEFTIEAGTIRIVVEDSEAVFTEFTLQGSTQLAQGSWADIQGATFSAIDDSHYQFTAPLVNADREFFRVLASFLVEGLDPDGDGLPDALEELIGTNPEKFDTDRDGFSDGAEFAYGTEPDNAASKPLFLNLPTVNFVSANSTGEEGTSPHQVEIIFDQPYSGLVNYSVNSLGNTVAGTDFALGENPEATTGSIEMDGTPAFLPLTIIDDSIVSGQRAVILDLELNGENYFIGGRSSHAVILEDNDAWWTGSLIPASGETDGRIFRLKVAREGSGTSVVFGGGAGQDGLPIPDEENEPDIATTSISTSLVPEGSWAATVNEDSDTRFSVVSPELPVSTGGLLGDEMIMRQIILEIQPLLSEETRPHILADFRYSGGYTEILKNNSGVTLGTFPGSFQLFRDLPEPLPVLTNLIPTAP